MLRLVRRAVPYLLLGLLTLLVAAAVGIGLRDQPSANNGTATSGVAEASAAASASTIPNSTTLTAPTTTTLPLRWGAVVPSTDVAPCQSASVQITPDGHAAAGTVIVYLGIVNVGNIPCSLEGYPKVLGLNSAGLPVAQALELDRGFAWGEYPYPRPPIVVLAPGETAHATVFGNDYDFYGGMDGAADCPFYPGLSVTLPGDDVAKVVSMTNNFEGVAGCGGAFSVNFVRPG